MMTWHRLILAECRKDLVGITVAVSSRCSISGIEQVMEMS